MRIHKHTVPKNRALQYSSNKEIMIDNSRRSSSTRRSNKNPPVDNKIQEAVTEIEDIIFRMLFNNEADLNTVDELAKDQFETEFERINEENDWISEEDYGDDGIQWELAKQEFLHNVLAKNKK